MRATEEIPLSSGNGVTTTRLQQVREHGDCDKTTTFYAMPCSREDRDCVACEKEATARQKIITDQHKKERDERERKRQIPIDITPLGGLTGSDLLKELQQRANNRWTEIKEIESSGDYTRTEAVDEYDTRHGIERGKVLSLIPATFGHYGGSFIKITAEQATILKAVFKRLYPRREIAVDSVYFGNGSKGMSLLDALDGIIFKLDYPEYWD